nr:hypothetical protein GCM10020092_094720 [Actinoplanes digitatis]
MAAHGADIVVADVGELLAASTAEVHRAGPRDHRLVAAARRIIADTGDYPPDPWRMVERAYNPDYVEQTETLFAVSNGFLGIRASFEEGQPSYRPTTLLNGFHETWPIVYPESAHGFASTGQTILPVPDGTTIRLLVDDDPVTCETTEVHEFERTLDMRRGVLERSVVYQLVDGQRFRLHTTRFVSLAQRHLACIRYELTALDAPGQLTLSSELVTRHPAAHEPADDPRRSRVLTGEALAPDADSVEDVRVIRTYRTLRSGLMVAAGMDHEFDESVITYARTTLDADRAHVVFDVDARPGQTATLTKWLAYHYDAADATDLPDRAEATLHQARSAGYAAVLAEHERQIGDFWTRSDIAWEGRPAVQHALRFNLFSIMQATSRTEGHGVPAKGLTGTGYEGHYFWDTEVYVLPFLIHTAPSPGPQPAHAPGADASVRPPPGARGRLRRCVVPVAHHQRRGGLGLLRGGHRPVPHRRRHRPRPRPVRPRDRRHRPAVQARRRGPDRDRAHVDGPGLLLRAPRRPVRDPQGDRTRRVQHGGEQQPVHQPHGRREPENRRGRR